MIDIHISNNHNVVTIRVQVRPRELLAFIQLLTALFGALVALVSAVIQLLVLLGWM